MRPSVILLERGQILDLCGKRLSAMGGASSHDIQDGILEPGDPQYERKFQILDARGAAFRVNHLSWWKEQLPSEEECEEARANLVKSGWSVDYIITRCASTSLQTDLLRELSRPDRLTDSLDEARCRCRFKYWFFGHYHSNGVIQDKFALLYERLFD